MSRPSSRREIEAYELQTVSLTSQCSKLLKSIYRYCLTEHFEKNCIITDVQHEFRTGRSFLSNLLLFLNRVSERIDSVDAVDAVYLDFAKAFGKVPYERLLFKLENYVLMASY